MPHDLSLVNHRIIKFYFSILNCQSNEHLNTDLCFVLFHRENHEQEKQSLNSIAENTVAMEVT